MNEAVKRIAAKVETFNAAELSTLQAFLRAYKASDLKSLADIAKILAEGV